MHFLVDYKFKANGRCKHLCKTHVWKTNRTELHPKILTNNFNFWTSWTVLSFTCKKTSIDLLWFNQVDKKLLLNCFACVIYLRNADIFGAAEWKHWIVRKAQKTHLSIPKYYKVEFVAYFRYHCTVYTHTHRVAFIRYRHLWFAFFFFSPINDRIIMQKIVLRSWY